MDTIKNFKSLVDSSKKILLVFPYVITADTCASVALLYKLLSEKFGKEVDVAASNTIPARYNDIISLCGINADHIISEIEPISYVIDVPDALKDNVDVKWNRKDDTLQVVLTPDTQEINFDQISFAREGGIYDLVITVNAVKLEDLGSIYTEAEKQFTKYQIVAVGYRSKVINESKVTLSGSSISTSAEVVKKLYEDLGFAFDAIEAEVFVHGVLGSGEGFNGRFKSYFSTVKNVVKIAEKFKFDVAAVIAKYNASESKEMIRLYERMFRNIQFDDEKKVVYSTLTNEDFSQTGTTPLALAGLQTLPFNLNTQDYDFAFLAYGDGYASEIILTANKQNSELSTFLKRLGGYGDRNFGLIRLDEDLNSAVQSVLNVVRGESSEDALQPEPIIIPAPLVLEENVDVNQPEVEVAQQPENLPVPVTEEEPIAPVQDQEEAAKSELPEQLTPVFPPQPQVITEAIPEEQNQVISNPVNDIQTSTGIPQQPITSVQEQQPVEQLQQPKPVQALEPVKSPFEPAQGFVVDPNAPVSPAKGVSGSPFEPASSI